MWKRRNAEVRAKRTYKTADEVGCGTRELRCSPLLTFFLSLHASPCTRVVSGSVPRLPRPPSACLPLLCPAGAWRAGPSALLCRRALYTTPQHNPSTQPLFHPAQVLEEAGEKPAAAAAERQTIIDMRGPQARRALPCTFQANFGWTRAEREGQGPSLLSCAVAVLCALLYCDGRPHGGASRGHCLAARGSGLAEAEGCPGRPREGRHAVHDPSHAEHAVHAVLSPAAQARVVTNLEHLNVQAGAPGGGGEGGTTNQLGLGPACWLGTWPNPACLGFFKYASFA